MKYINIIVENKSKHTDNFFTYSADDSVKIGDKVKIPFGKTDKEKEGYVFDFIEPSEIDYDLSKIKNIIGIDEETCLTEEIIKTAKWMKQKYAIKYFDAIHSFIAKGKPAKEGKNKEPYKDIKTEYIAPMSLTDEQQSAVDKINNSIETNKNDIYLVHGITASGKTEVYMSVIEKCLSLGKTAIMLVPEISLTSQVIERFVGRFGKESIAILHSKLTPRERYDEWERIKKGKAKIVIGARMAVFSPLENIGAIILDEEHEATYKADMTPKYDTVEVAAKRLQFYNGVLVLGSATPSVVSYQRAKDGIYKLIELKNRYNNTPLPRVEIVDMRAELRNGNASIFSNFLKEKIDETLSSGEQVILLQNRRGYSNFVSCRECGNVIKCPECNISLTYHKSIEKLVCHYCGKTAPVPKKCPECDSKYIKYFGIGTEQVVEACTELFQSANVDRLDIDSIKNRKELDAIIAKFKRGETNILVGTQLVAKGLDFKNVGLVGVIAADVTLNIPDYRSEERTFQLVTQVSGRAGRGDKQGLVVIQTYEPDNYVFRATQNNSYDDFFNKEQKIRELMEYPPFGDIIMASFTADDEKIALDCADRCQKYLQNIPDLEINNRVLSPKLALNFKGNGSYRYYIIVKSPKGERNRYVYYLDSFAKILINDKFECNMNIDINPYSII